MKQSCKPFRQYIWLKEKDEDKDMLVVIFIIRTSSPYLSVSDVLKYILSILHALTPSVLKITL